MLCEIARAWGFASPLYNFAATWAVLTALGGVSVCLLSGSVFWRYYAAPTFEQWQRKLNPDFPPASRVKLEVLQMFKSLFAATLVPALTLTLSAEGRGQAYCGVGEGHFGLSAPAYLAASFAFCWIASDLYEWAYHQVGHRVASLWRVHKRASARAQDVHRARGCARRIVDRALRWPPPRPPPPRAGRLGAAA